MSAEKNFTIKEDFELAIQNHQNKNLQDAQNYYQKVLKVEPNHSPSLNNLGVVFQELGKNQKAKACFEKTIEISPNHVQALNNLGVILLNDEEYRKAKNCLEKVIKINPKKEDAHKNLGFIFYVLKDYQKAKDHYIKVIEINPIKLEALYSLGVIYQESGELQKAKDYFEKTIKIDPNYVQAINSLGTVFLELGENQKAKSYFEKTIEINPNHVQALNNLGFIFYILEDYQKAKVCYEKTIEINPNYVNAHLNLSTLHIATLDDLEKSISSSYRALKMSQNDSKFINQSVPLFRLKHDVQQAEYLVSKNYKIEGIDDFKKIGSEILDRVENKEDENNYNKKILLTSVEINALLPFYKSDYVYKPKAISGSCINSNKNWRDVEDEYFNSLNQIIYIDDFLSDEVLQELREFCLVSKVWNREYYNPFLGAYANQGFISPIHLQIALELKQKLPKLFGPHKLGQFWGFKYDAKLGKGINIHADFAIHNLNFWITPDEYNNNKNSGGLKVYDAPAPDHWTFKDYNANPEKIYKFLKDKNANCTNVPYKFNRAVLFNSAYFHETDEIDFRDEYEGRRINNTYLFGNRK